jgi:hypothetical protein
LRARHTIAAVATCSGPNTRRTKARLIASDGVGSSVDHVEEQGAAGANLRRGLEDRGDLGRPAVPAREHQVGCQCLFDAREVANARNPPIGEIGRHDEHVEVRLGPGGQGPTEPKTTRETRRAP